VTTMSGAPRRLPRRPTDRVEDLVAWVLTAAALLVVVGACLTGIAVHGNEAARVHDGGTVFRVPAVLLADATVTTGEYGMHRLVTVPARWTDRDGLEHVDAVVVTRSAPAGTEIAVWIDSAGKITAPPVHPVNAVVGGIVAAIGVLCAGTTLLVAIWLGVRAVTGRVNSRRWEEGWARVEPLWRRSVL
jgi:hypothetical protein